MDSSWEIVISSAYLVILALIRLLEVLQMDVRKLQGKEPRVRRPSEDGRIVSLLAQYLSPVSDSPRSRSWWQQLLDALAWLEPLAVVYFMFVAIRYDEPRPLLIVLAALGFLLLNNIWRAEEFSVRKKLRLTALLPVQLIPYYTISSSYTARDIYKFAKTIVTAFASRELRIPLNLGLSDKRK